MAFCDQQIGTMHHLYWEHKNAQPDGPNPFTGEIAKHKLEKEKAGRDLKNIDNKLFADERLKACERSQTSDSALAPEAVATGGSADLPKQGQCRPEPGQSQPRASAEPEQSQGRGSPEPGQSQPRANPV